MKLEATCQNCGRRFLIAQIRPEPEGTGGRCPFCGRRFARHYVATLPHVLDAAEQAADAFLSALEHLNDMHPGFQVEYGPILKRLSEELAIPFKQPA
jgi:DNA-directed RNA polymerase subunit RPC12/RpoP